MPIFDHFDFIASRYERLVKPKEPRELLGFLNLPASGVLLDAGGGTGRVAQYLTGEARTVIVADLSRRMLAEALRKPALRPICSVTERLPFADGSFARIIIVDALHHVLDQQATADELWRTLEPGGRIVIEEPDQRRFVVKLWGLAEKLALMRSRILSPQRIAALFPKTEARIRIEAQDFRVWIIVDKTR